MKMFTVIRKRGLWFHKRKPGESVDSSPARDTILFCAVLIIMEVYVNETPLLKENKANYTQNAEAQYF